MTKILILLLLFPTLLFSQFGTTTIELNELCMIQH